MEKHRRKNITGKGIVYYWLPVVVWMVTIFFLSSRHSVTVSPVYFWNFIFFKTLHLIEYAALFTLNARAFFASGARKKREACIYAFILTILYAMSDEFHQRFVPSRSPQPRDVIIDGIGAGITWYLLLTQLPKLPKRLKAWVSALDLPL